MCDLFDLALLKLLRQGGVLVLSPEDGKPVLGDDGKPMYRWSAAYLNVIRARLKDVGLERQGLRTPQRTLIEEAMARGVVSHGYEVRAIPRLSGEAS
jgi:hypothetical protein